MIANNHIFEGIDPDGFEEYRDFMYENYCVLTENKLGFITDKWFTPSFKCERLQELLDFFLLEEEYEKCQEISKIKQAVDVQVLLEEIPF
jgi:hypothetical protein